MTFGFSRDDAAKFLTAYYDTKIYESDPFQHLDQIGVGKLVKMAAHDAARPTRTWVWASAASTAAIPAVSSSAQRAWTTSAALPTVFPSPAWPLHRQQLKIHALKSRRFLQLNVDYDKARSYRNSRGCVLWPKQWKDLTVKVVL